LRSVADWTTISSLATAGGTLVLAVATFSAVRSSNRSARVAEQALQEQRRPVLVSARLDDPAQKVMFVDGRWLRTEGSQAVIEEEDGTLFLALPIRNIGSGIAVVQGWYPWPELARSEVEHRPPEEFRRQVRHIYVAPGDVGMWQGALREASDELTRTLTALRVDRRAFTIDLLYSDQFGGQRAISRFVVTPAGEDRWLGNVGFHWDLDVSMPGEARTPSIRH
jgi:hypothetical protein